MVGLNNLIQFCGSHPHSFFFAEEMVCGSGLSKIPWKLLSSKV